MNKKQTLLWQIDRDDLLGSSYLFGTMHVRDNKAFTLIEQVEKLMKRCDALATEYDLDDQGNSEGLSDIFSAQQSLEEALPLKTYTKLKSVLWKNLGKNLDFLKQASPFMVTNAIAAQVLSQDTPLSLDEHLWHFAKDANKQTIGIETLAEQLAIVQEIPASAHIKNLAHIASNFTQYRKQIIKMADWYAAGNIAQLHRASIKGQGSLKRLLIYDRNAIMAERIEQIIGRQTTVCAIGAGHLAGEKGVLRLLKFKGLKIRPLKGTNSSILSPF